MCILRFRAEKPFLTGVRSHLYTASVWLLITAKKRTEWTQSEYLVQDHFLKTRSAQKREESKVMRTFDVDCSAHKYCSSFIIDLLRFVGCHHTNFRYKSGVKTNYTSFHVKSDVESNTTFRQTI